MTHSNFDTDSFDLDNIDAYARWRDAKLKDYPQNVGDLVVELADYHNPTEAEVAELKKRVDKMNMAVYVCTSSAGEGEASAKLGARALGARFGMHRIDANLYADDDEITSLTVAADGPRTRYIPYTNRRISWHTDGYYNTMENQIRAMVLHCVSPSATGGENAVMDPEIAYIYMRDKNPDFIRVLMHEEAMFIPPNDEGNGEIREGRTGPVFSLSPHDGSLHMRYTARTRSISWREDETTQAAVAFLEDLLKGDSPYIFRHRMAAGQGLLCNNVLHDRNGFEDDETHKRLYLRARFFDRIKV